TRLFYGFGYAQLLHRKFIDIPYGLHVGGIQLLVGEVHKVVVFIKDQHVQPSFRPTGGAGIAASRDERPIGLKGSRRSTSFAAGGGREAKSTQEGRSETCEITRASCGLKI